MTPISPRHRFALDLTAALAVILLVGCWLLDVAGRGGGAFASGGQALLVVSGLLLAARATLAIRPALGRGRAARRRRWLLALVALALVVRLVGADHEVEERAYRDEGTYYHHASEINDGELLRWSFIYPHFTYYAYAFTLWLADLFPAAWSSFALYAYGVEEPLARAWLALRLLVALLSAATVVPVFGIARRLGGTLAGALAALLFVASPAINEGSHLIISDVPAACLATFCLLPVARLARRETLRDYLLAGVLSGLAAATKYPAGIVAVAIVAVWVRGRLRTRRLSPSLLWAGAASLAAFVAAMPSLLWAPRHALSAQGIFFGVEQYARGGWIGVQPDSHALFYGGQLAANFGLPALALGIGGLVLLPPARRRLMLWLLPFPLLYLWLIVSMQMVVRRNLFPALPVLAALLGAGIAVWIARLAGARQGVEKPRRRARQVAAALLAIAALAWPLAHTAMQSAGFAAPSTRDLASRWIAETLPPGVKILREEYTPKLDRGRFAVDTRRFAAHVAPEELAAEGYDYVLLADSAYARFLDRDNLTRDHHRVFAERYRRMLAEYPEARDFRPGARRRGPWLRLLRVPPAPAARARLPLPAHRAFVADGAMAAAGAGEPVRFTRPGQWALLKADLTPGVYRVRLDARATSGPAGAAAALRVLALGPAPAPTVVRLPDGAWRLTTEAADRYLLYVYLPAGSELDGMVVIAR